MRTISKLTAGTVSPVPQISEVTFPFPTLNCDSEPNGESQKNERPKWSTSKGHGPRLSTSDRLKESPLHLDDPAPERTLGMRKLLNVLPRRDQCALIRYYLLGQTKDRICTEMSLAPADFDSLRADLFFFFRAHNTTRKVINRPSKSTRYEAPAHTEEQPIALRHSA